MEQVGADVRFATRTLRKSPGFTAVVVATLAVGIGLLTAIVDVATPILWPQLPFPEADRLVMLRRRNPETKSVQPLRGTQFGAVSEHAAVFSAIGAETVDTLNLVVAGEPSPVRVSTVTDGFFRALGVTSLYGRLFLADDFAAANAGEAVVLSHAAWMRFFGNDPAVLGRNVTLGGRLRTVVGVLAPGFKSLPTSVQSANETDGIYLSSAGWDGLRNVTAIARLNPGITLAQAEAQLRTINLEAGGAAGGTAGGSTGAVMMKASSTSEALLTPLPDLLRESRAQPFRIFLGAAGALYLIGCMTVGNLMLSRAVGRRRELGVRLALGGSRGRIARLVVVEALFLAVIGAAAGTLLAVWAQTALANLTPAGTGMELTDAGGFPWRTLGLALALGIPTCCLPALASARRTSHQGLADALKEGAGTQGDSRRLRLLRGAFVVTQSAFAVALLVGAGLMLRTVARLQAIELGFNPAQRLVIFGRRPAAAVDPESTPVRNAEIVARIAALPGVAQAAQAGSAPLAGSMVLGDFLVDGRDPTKKSSAFIFAVTPGYFQALGMTFVAGAGFADSASNDQRVAVVSESMAREQFPDENPVGRTILFNKQRFEIVGVVRDVVTGYRGALATGTGGKSITQLYLPMGESVTAPLGYINVVVQLVGKPGPGFVAAIQRAIFSV
ncbi:MAG: ABC transporter permease, partial [Opitutaceae bacterium]